MPTRECVMSLSLGDAIPGTTKVAHMEENVAAADLTLSAGELQEIEAGFAALAIQGARSSDAVLSLIDIGAKAGTTSAGSGGLSPARARR